MLGLLTALGPLTIDMYLPALPTITADLHTTAAAVQLTLTGTLAGLALGQLLIGPVSDAQLSFGSPKSCSAVQPAMSAIPPNIGITSATM